MNNLHQMNFCVIINMYLKYNETVLCSTTAIIGLVQLVQKATQHIAGCSSPLIIGLVQYDNQPVL